MPMGGAQAAGGQRAGGAGSAADVRLPSSVSALVPVPTDQFAVISAALGEGFQMLDLRSLSGAHPRLHMAVSARLH